MNIRGQILRITLALLALGLVSSCGNDDEGPANGDILINPSSQRISISHDTTALATCVPQIVDVPYVVSVFDEFGREVPGAEVTVTLTFAPDSASPGLNVLFLYDSDETGAPLTLVDSPFRSPTNGRGQKYVVARLLTGCAIEYDSNLSAFSGPLFELATINVSSPGFTP